MWKVSPEGELLSIIYKTLVGLNGIVYHPDGYLIVIPTLTGNLFKIDLANGNAVKLINVVGGPLSFGDGPELVSPTKLVVAGNPLGRLVESSDGWESASLVAKFKGQASPQACYCCCHSEGWQGLSQPYVWNWVSEEEACHCYC
ncbi:hypothetical protein SAY86_006796 [Trapa natans]|uniref:Uncharacterized protein n=1 Tax=Trapa natans TaxID=22666 RepID=A0AAN7QXY8_TRANT|nr:hypothetical protein SAY86_006796 [Trapa natans]